MLVNVSSTQPISRTETGKMTSQTRFAELRIHTASSSCKCASLVRDSWQLDYVQMIVPQSYPDSIQNNMPSINETPFNFSCVCRPFFYGCPLQQRILMQKCPAVGGKDNEDKGVTPQSNEVSVTFGRRIHLQLFLQEINLLCLAQGLKSSQCDDDFFVTRIPSTNGLVPGGNLRRWKYTP